MALVERIRRIATGYFIWGHYESALFWTDKLVSLSNESLPDVVQFVRCLLELKQHQRALAFMRPRELHKRSGTLKYLMAKCLSDCQLFEDAISVIEAPVALEAELDDIGVGATPIDWTIVGFSHESVTNGAMLLLLGRNNEMSDNRQQAANAYMEALRADLFCYPALKALISNCLLSSEEELELFDSLPWKEQCASDEEFQLVQFLYKSSLNKYSRPEIFTLPTAFVELRGNSDVTVAQAERLYYNNSAAEAYCLTAKVLSREEFHLDAIAIHICILVELDKTIELFSLAHRLVDHFPSHWLSWYAVGCYYYSIKKFDVAKQHLAKCSRINSGFGPGLLMYGHSFAMEREHDQAMNSYMKAAKVMRGCHLPLLYIGLEYSMTNNHKLAEKFFQEALAVAPKDPHVLHELAVLEFRLDHLSEAEKLTRTALALLDEVHGATVPATWEPLLNNMAHICRKQKKYDEALAFHRKALHLCPKQPSTLGAMGLVYALKGEYDMAIEYCHKCLSYKKDEAIMESLLNKVMELSTEGTATRVTLFPDVPSMKLALNSTASSSQSSCGSSKRTEVLKRRHMPIDSLTPPPPVFDVSSDDIEMEL